MHAARDSYDHELPRLTSGGDPYPTACLQNAIGNLEAFAGHLSAAEVAYSKAISAFGELEELGDQATATTNAGELLERQGKIPAAEERYLKALAAHRAVGNSDGASYDRLRLGEIDRLRGHLPLAAKLCAAALIPRPQDQAVATSVELTSAKLELDSGRICQAERVVCQVLGVTGGADSGAPAHLLEAEVAIIRNDFDGAQAALDQFFAAPGADPSLPLKARLLRARINAHRGEIRSALQELHEVATSGAESYREIQLQARLEYAEIEASEALPSAKADLAAVARDARVSDFFLIATEAEAASKSLRATGYRPL